MNEDAIDGGDGDPGTVADRADRVEGFAIEPGSRTPLDFRDPAAAGRRPGGRAGSRRFAPPLAPPPGADQLTIDAYALERVAYEMATRDDGRRTDIEAGVPETEFETA